MAKENSLGSWIDQERMEELLGVVRPGSLEKATPPLADTMNPGEEARPENVVESLLADEIPEHVFMKSRRPKLPPPEPRAPRRKPKPLPTDAAPLEEPPQGPSINPLNLYFHSTAQSAEARAKEFVGWVRETSDSASAFVVDAYGAAIAAEPKADPVFLASLSHLADALGRGRDHFSQQDQSALHLEMSENEILCVVQAKWDVATVALGLLRDSPLPREAAIRYRQELAKLAHKPRRRPRD